MDTNLNRSVWLDLHQEMNNNEKEPTIHDELRTDDAYDEFVELYYRQLRGLLDVDDLIDFVEEVLG